MPTLIGGAFDSGFDEGFDIGVLTEEIAGVAQGIGAAAGFFGRRRLQISLAPCSFSDRDNVQGHVRRSSFEAAAQRDNVQGYVRRG